MKPTTQTIGYGTLNTNIFVIIAVAAHAEPLLQE